LCFFAALRLRVFALAAFAFKWKMRNGKWFFLGPSVQGFVEEFRFLDLKPRNRPLPLKNHRVFIIG
jgi:hypothetical protein